jgi:branched-chain amino acid aminotransferase
MHTVNYNGRLVSPETPVFQAGNRGFRYGDGVFESLFFDGARMPLLHLHLQRLFAGMQALGMRRPPHYESVFFEEEIRKTLIPGRPQRVRLSVFRKEGGLYLPHTDEPEFLAEASPWQEPRSPFPAFLPQSGFLPAIPVAPNLLAPFKTANSLIYILASRLRKVKGWEEGVLLNLEGRIADGCYSNVFAFRKGALITPTVQEGALAGVMRSVVLRVAEKKGLPVEVRPIPVNEWLEADEIWYTNALNGVRWVHQFENRRLENEVWNEFFSDWRGLLDQDLSDFAWIQ